MDDTRPPGGDTARRIADVFAGGRALAGSGLLRPIAPRRILDAGRALRHWGATYAGGFAASAARHPNRACVIDPAGTLSWAEVDRRSDALARALVARGVNEASVVALLCRNNRHFIVATAALAKTGCTVLLANTGFAGPQLRDVLDREGARLMVCDASFVPLVTNDDGSLHLDVMVADEDGPVPDGAVTLTDVIDHAPPGSRPNRPVRAGRMVILTSGTTGTPKGAPRPQSAGIETAAAMLERIPYRDGDTVVLAAPLFHAWGFAHVGLATLLGWTMVLRPRFDPALALGDVVAHNATALVVVPVMAQRMLEVAEPPSREALGSLRVTAASGSALPGGLATEWMDRFGDNLYNLYGSTEVGWASIATPDDLRADPATAGRPPLGVEVRIVDESGRRVPTGHTGRIFVGSSLTFDGYTDGRNKEILDGLMSTGDTGRLDGAGRLRVEGRGDDMIVSGGENVFPREVEECIEAMDGVSEAAVVGVADDGFGQRLVAWVVRTPAAATKDGDPAVDADAVRSHVSATLARFKVPRDVHFCDVLPRNATGKLLRNQLGDN